MKGNGIAHPAPIPMARKLLGFVIVVLRGLVKNVVLLGLRLIRPTLSHWTDFGFILRSE